MNIFNLKRMFKIFKSRFIKSKILAVHENDLEKLLISLNLINDLKEGRISCNTCGKKINLNCIGGLKKQKGSVIIFCDKFHCISENK